MYWNSSVPDTMGSHPCHYILVHHYMFFLHICKPRVFKISSKCFYVINTQPLGLLGWLFWAYHRSFSPICPLIHLLKQALWFSHNLIMHFCMPAVLFPIWLLENSYSLFNEQLKCHFLQLSWPHALTQFLSHQYICTSIITQIMSYYFNFFMPLSPFLVLWLPSYSLLYPQQSIYFYKINKWEN